jgi:hypothetical protein
MQPIFGSESRHLSEVTEVGCQEQRFVHDRGGGDFEVLGSDADTLFSKPLEFIGRSEIKRSQMPV